MLGGYGLSRSAATAKVTSGRLTLSLNSSRSLSTAVFRSTRETRRIAGTQIGVIPAASGRGSLPAVSQLAFVRFNSTDSTATSTTTPPDAASATETTVNTININGNEVPDIPEKIGYLHELGMDYGWGPTSLVQWVVEHIHIYSGLPWWASIVATGILTRLVLAKPVIDSMETANKVRKLRAITQPITQRMWHFQRVGNTLEVAKARAELQDIHREHGVNPIKGFLPLLIQIPIGFGTFRLVRGMAALPVPGLATEQLGWLSDMSLSDPFYILPLVAATTIYFNLRLSAKQTPPGSILNSPMAPATRAIIPAISFIAMSWLPSALQLYFTTTGAMVFGQSWLLSFPKVRQALGLSPLAVEPTSQGTNTTSGPQLRLIDQMVEAQRARAMGQTPTASEQQPADMNVSAIDRMMANIKKNLAEARRDATERLNQITGQDQQAYNADGSPAPPPRLSKKDLKVAAEYQRRRQEEEDALREERNHARREAYLRAMEQEQQQSGAQAWRKHRKTPARKL